MNERTDTDIFDANLKRAGRVLEMPAPPTDEQRAKWKRTSAPTEAAPHHNNGRLRYVPAPRRRFNPTFLSRGLIGGALAASIILIAWLSVDRHQTVSAQTILASLAETMTRSIWVELDDIDLGSAIFRGRFYWGEPDDGGVPSEYYSEVYVDLRPDNPEWDVYDVISVIYQSDEEKWHFTRGSGSAGHTELPDGLLKVNSFESFWREQPKQDLRESFEFRHTIGGMWGVGVGTGESSVRYEFTTEQFDVIGQTIDWLRGLHEAHSPQVIVEQLGRIAGKTTVTTQDRTTLRLTARDLRLDAIEEYERQVDDTVVAFRDEKVRFDADGGGMGWTGYRMRPAELADHRAIRAAVRDLEEELRKAGRSPERIAEVYRGYTDHVEVTLEEDGSWEINARNIRIQGVAPTLPPGARPLPELLRDAMLVVRFDLLEQRVIDAEFWNIGGEGVIRIRDASDGLDPSLRDPQPWESRAAVAKWADFWSEQNDAE